MTGVYEPGLTFEIKGSLVDFSIDFVAPVIIAEAQPIVLEIIKDLVINEGLAIIESKLQELIDDLVPSL